MKKYWIIAGVVLLLLVGVGLWYFKSYKPKKDLEDLMKKMEAEDKKKQETFVNPLVPKKENDDFPLIEGSYGDRVSTLQKMINKIAPQYPIPIDGKFGHATYLALITGVGTSYYPVSVSKFVQIQNLSKNK